MGQKVNPLILRAEVNGFWKFKIYPSNYKNVLTKKYNIHKLLQVYFKFNRISLIKYKIKQLQVHYLMLYVYRNSFWFKGRRDKTFSNLNLLKWYGEYWFELTDMISTRFLNINLYSSFNKNFIFFHIVHDNIEDIPIENTRLVYTSLELKSYQKDFYITSLRKQNSGFKLKGSTKPKVFMFFLMYYVLFSKKVGKQGIISLMSVLFYNKLSFIYTLKLIYGLNKLNKFNSYNIVPKIFSRLKFGFISKYLFYKILRIELETLIFYFFKIKFTIGITNIKQILNFNELIRVPSTDKLWFSRGRFYFKDLVQGFFWGMFLKDSTIVGFFITKHLTNKRAQQTYMKGVNRILLNLLGFIKLSEFLGLRITVHGKFRGRLRKGVYRIFEGYRSLTRKRTVVDFSFHKMYSRFGVFSIKVWLFYKC